MKTLGQAVAKADPPRDPGEPAAQERPGVALGRLALCLAVFALLHATYSAWDEGVTVDEPDHFRWSERLLEGVTERDSGRYDSKAPILVPSVLTHRLAAAAGVTDSKALRFATRLPSLGWLAALLATTFLLARRLFGSRAAQLATCGVALDPSVVAHGSVATVDMAYAVATLATLGAAFLFGESPSPRRGVALGFAAGLALATKFTALLLLLGVLVLLPAVLRKPWSFHRRGLAGLALAAATAWAVLWGAYLFRDWGAPLGSRAWQTTPMRALAALAPHLPAPVPLAFLTGFDLSRAHERAQNWGVFLFGHHFPDGVWYYFAALWVLKTPLLALAGQVVGLGRSAWDALQQRDPALAFLAASLAWHLGYFSFLFRTQIGYRFVLMCIPIAWILAAAGLCALRKRRWAAPALVIAVLLSLLENVAYFGNPLSFTNAAVRPKHSVYRLTADSNLDWGQNRDKIVAWLGERGVNPQRLEPVHVLSGQNVLNVNTLVKGWDVPQYRWLREHVEPTGHFGHTYVMFEVGEALYGQFLDEIRSSAPSDSGGLCSADLVGHPLTRDAPVRFQFDAPPRPERVWIACVSAPEGADVGLEARNGCIHLGHAETASVPPSQEFLGEAQVAWHRLQPGEHLLVLSEVATQRGLPFRFRGRWLAQRHAVRLVMGEAIVVPGGRLTPTTGDSSLRDVAPLLDPAVEGVRGPD